MLVQTSLALLLLCLTSGCAHVDERHTTSPHVSQSIAPDPSVVAFHPDHRDAGRSALESSVLTLDSLERLALERHPELGISAARIDAFRGAHRQATLYPNPHAGYHATEVGNLSTAGQQGGFVGQKFITGGKLELDQDVASRQIEQTCREFDTAAQRVLNEVRVRFYEVLIAQRRIELTTELVQLARESVDVSRKLFQSQLVGRNDLLQSQIRQDSSEILLEAAHNNHSAAWRRLAVAVGDSGLHPTPIEGDLTADLLNYDFDERLAAVLAMSPELLAADAQIDVARSRLERASHEWIPDVDLSVSVRHHNVTRDDVVNIQAGMPIPIFDRNEGNIDSAQANVIAAGQQVERLRLQLRDRVASEYRRYADARIAYRRHRDSIVPRAKESLELTQGAYTAQQVPYLELLNAQETYVRVHLAQLDALREMRISQVALEGLVVQQP